MRKIVKEVVGKCHSCAQNKKGRHLPYGKMEPITPPGRAWKTVTMDFITKLPKSKEPMTKTVYDSILVGTCKLTKEIHLVPYQETSNAKDLLYNFIKYLVSRHKMLEQIISN